MNHKLHLQKLDDIRGFAAVYVVGYHLFSSATFMPEWMRVFFSFGQEAVILFFLLSGFVIYTASCQDEKLNFKKYFIKRFRRIYFPFFVSIIISILVFAFNGELQEEFSGFGLIGNIFMLQDLSIVKPGVAFKPFLHNYPLWSLSYEWWFYMLFYFLYHNKKFFTYKYKIYAILLVSCIAYIIYIFFPNPLSQFLAYFIIWWSGLTAAEIYLSTQRFSYQRIKPILICLFFMSVMTALPVAFTHEIRLGYYPFLNFRHFCFAFIAIAIGLFWYQRNLVYFNKTLGIFSVVAPISYGLYILHYPILMQWKLNVYISNWVMEYVIKFALVIGLAYLVEIKLQPIVNKWLK